MNLGWGRFSRTFPEAELFFVVGFRVGKGARSGLKLKEELEILEVMMNNE